jgi:maleate cis-trans isomerase
LEGELGRPVLTANQVLLWAALRAADVRSTVADYGQILTHLA